MASTRSRPQGSAAASIGMVVNGAAVERPAAPGRSLLEMLREELGLTGAKYGCGEGECGACTVLIDGAPVRACVAPLAAMHGRRVVTVEALAQGDTLHPVQSAFVEAGAAQCGYCTPGMVLTCVALLDRVARPSDAEIVEAMNGNVCRCGGYPGIVKAVRLAAEHGPPQAPPPRPPAVPAWSPRAAPWDLHAAADRDVLDVAGDGLVVVLPAEPEEHAWRPGSIGGGAWLHVGGDGIVTVFAGKVSVGQGTRAALALLAAEELATAPGQVRVAMGDTDVCPYDMGTFGSRSMPIAGRATRIAAAAAADALRRLAADRWRIGVDEVSLAGGCAVARDGRRAPFGDLVAGLRAVEIAAAGRAPSPPAGWVLAGTDQPDPWQRDAVTGARRFPTDITRAGLLHGRVVRPPALGARVVSADLSGVAELPGTVAIHEDGLVAVAAEDLRTATLAADRARVEWEQTAQPPERELAAHLRSHPVEVDGWGGADSSAQGDPERALAEASKVLAETYTTAYIAHAPLETRAAVAEWTGGRLTVWVGTQTPFLIRHELAEELGIDEARVRVVVPDTGGGFGGKHSAETALSAARLARASGRPVKVRWTREEEFRWGYFRPAAVIDVKSGVDRDGRLSAWTFLNLNSGAAAMRTPYTVPHQRVGFQPADSPLPQGAYRSLAAVANTFARECHVDRVARRGGRDPLEFRLEHLADERLRAVLEAAAERAGWPRGTSGGGLGIAVGVEKGGHVATCAEVTPAETGGLRVLRIVTAFECGAIVHPRNLRAQVEGATVMGLGGALFEAVHFDGGRIRNASFAEYRVPRFADVPPIDVVLLDRPDIEPAGGGETPITAVAPALANALSAAGGGEPNALPFGVPRGG